MSQAIFNDGLGYEGKVTLTLKSNNRVLKSKTYKNKGTAQLFNFLGQCLTGSYEEANKLFPNKILLLYNKSNSPNSSGAETAVERRSTWQSLAQMPTIISKEAQVSVIYSFEVPRFAITGPFNQVALYGSEVTYDDLTMFSAYYFLTDGTGAFDLQDVEEWSATTVLLIEWELILSNKNVETNNN